MISGINGIKKTFGNDNIYLMPNNTNNFPSKALNIIRQKKLILRRENTKYDWVVALSEAENDSNYSTNFRFHC